MDKIKIALIIFIFIILLKDECYAYFTTSRIYTKIDGNKYPVISSYEDQQIASDLIGHINKFTLQLIKELKQTYLYIEPQTPEQIKGYTVATILSKRYHHRSLRENKPSSDKDTSYVQNKGQIISLCLREKQSGKNKFHTLDMLKFVMMHELSHIITPELDHSDLFWNNFRFILEFAERKGLYKSKDFSKDNELYCGLNIDYNPIFDDRRTQTYFPKLIK